MSSERNIDTRLQLRLGTRLTDMMSLVVPARVLPEIMYDLDSLLTSDHDRTSSLQERIFPALAPTSSDFRSVHAADFL